MDEIDPIKLAWSEEYRRKGIPSSFRKDPTKPLIEFIAWLRNRRDFVGKVAGDIGCGLGRNSFYLASEGFKVIGLDLLKDNAKAVNTESELQNLPIYIFAQDASSEWPMEANSLDIVIDIFCYKHIVNKSKQAKYRYELWKALKPTGFYFISLASENDGFYGPLLETSMNRADKLILDPYSNICSFLYSKEDLEREFSDYFEILEINEKTSTSPMYDKEYTRKVLNAIFKKVDKLTTR